MKQRKSTIIAKSVVGTGLLVSMSGALAHTINHSYTSHNTHAVPLSLTSTIVLGILLLAVGVFVLPRMQGRHIRTLATTTILAGIITAGVGGKLVSDAIAGIPTVDCNISHDIPTCDYDIFVKGNANIDVTNDANQSIIVDVVPDTETTSTNNPSLNLRVVELVKGPLKRSVTAGSGNGVCDFPHTLAPSETCTFNHYVEHFGNE